MIPPRTTRRQGFTLIELLTVIAIVGVLAAIVISTVSTVRSKARITRCLSNMRQAGVAFSLYAGDNRNTLPTQKTDGVPLTNSASWPAQLSPYVSDFRMLLCTESNPVHPYPNVSYIYNSFASRFSAPTKPPVKVTEAQNPAQAIVLLDTSNTNNTDKAYIITNVDVSATQSQLLPHPVGSTPRQSRSVLFLDGHVAMVKKGELSWRQLQWPQ